MRKIFRALSLPVLFAALCACGWAQTWQQVVPGVDYRYYRIDSPQNDIFVTRMDRTTTEVIIDASLANGKVVQAQGTYNAETIPSQVSRYNGGFGFWGRETARYRYKVVAAVNGCGFSTANGFPDSPMVIGGALVKRTYVPLTDGTPVENGGAMGFAYRLGSSAPTPGTPCMGGDFSLPPDPSKNRLSFTDGSWLRFDKINDNPKSDAIILYTHHYGASTPASASLTEIVVRMSNAQPLRIVPWSSYTAGSVVQIRQNSTGGTSIPFDCVVIAASGSAATSLNAKVPSVGTEVRFSLETGDSSGLDWTNMYTGIGPMWGVILRGGVKPSTSSASYLTAIAPRTAVAYSAQYIYFIVVDGRSARSSGMTLTDLADWCINNLQATDAVNNDGGGSSTMWVDGQVKNVPSDGSPRVVCNGLMIVRLEAKQTSSAFAANQSVVTNTPSTTLNMRTGPGTQFHVMQAINDATPLTIVDHNLKGLRVQDLAGAPSYWWKVRTTDGTEGWVAGAYLAPASGVDAWSSF